MTCSYKSLAMIDNKYNYYFVYYYHKNWNISQKVCLNY